MRARRPFRSPRFLSFHALVSCLQWLTTFKASLTHCCVGLVSLVRTTSGLPTRAVSAALNILCQNSSAVCGTNAGAANGRGQAVGPGEGNCGTGGVGERVRAVNRDDVARPKGPSMSACWAKPGGAGGAPVGHVRRLEKGFDCAGRGVGGAGAGSGSARAVVSANPATQVRGTPASAGAKVAVTGPKGALLQSSNTPQHGAGHSNQAPTVPPRTKEATSKGGTSSHASKMSGGMSAARQTGGAVGNGTSARGGGGGTGGGRSAGEAERVVGKEAEAGSKEVGASASTCSEDFPLGTLLDVLLDTGEWCSAKISAPKNKSLKYEVMFGDDESDKARSVRTSAARSG